MAQTSVSQYASELKVPPSVLLEQLRAAGVEKRVAEDSLSEQDKARLLEYLRKSHGSIESKNTITLTRKQTSEIKKSDSMGKARTIQVEVRKKRIFFGTSVELILNNPFRVLGLSATAGARDIAKRVSDLETFAELGKPKAYQLDFENLGRLDRGIEAIKDAARKIEQADGRLFHSFFWFRGNDTVDELAFESIGDSKIDEALDLWGKQLSKKSAKKHTWRLNRAVLRLLLASQREFDIDQFDNALEDLGFVIDDHLDDSIEEVLNGMESGINRELLWKKIVDELLLVAQAAPRHPLRPELRPDHRLVLVISSGGQGVHHLKGYQPIG